MVTLVFEGLRYMRVENLPLSSLVTRTSRNAIEFSSSSSLVNWTRSWMELRQSLKSTAGSLISVVEARPAVGHKSPAVVHVDDTEPGDGFPSHFGDLDCAVIGVDHPNLADRHHERKTNWATILLCVVCGSVEKIADKRRNRGSITTKLRRF